jgi:hypothetical protein
MPTRTESRDRPGHALRDPEVLRAECVRAEQELQTLARTTR